MTHTPMPTLTTAPPSALDDLTDEIWEAICNEQDMDTSLMDFAKAVVRDVPLVNAAPDLLTALEAMNALVTKAQGILEAHLYPDGAQDSDETVNRLLELLDGPEQRAAQNPAKAILAKAAGAV